MDHQEKEKTTELSSRCQTEKKRRRPLKKKEARVSTTYVQTSKQKKQKNGVPL